MTSSQTIRLLLLSALLALTSASPAKATLVHDFSTRSPNALGGEVAADLGSGSTYLAPVADSGSPSVPGTPQAKPYSQVGRILRGTTGNGVWYEAFATAQDVTTYTNIGFYIRVADAGGTLPFIIKSGTGAGSQAIVTNVADYIAGGGGLSTAWRWVQIPIVDFTGFASKTAITAFQVTQNSNWQGFWQPTSWDRDFWIDDIYLMPSTNFPVPAPPPPLPAATQHQRLHNFETRSPNDVGGDVAAEAGAVYLSGITDPGATNIPIVTNKQSSLVGKVERGAGPDGVWYEVLFEPTNLTVFSHIGFFMRTDADGGVVPTILKSGIGGGQQSIANAGDHVLGGGGLSTNWRWVQIPIGAFAGQADFTALESFHVAKQSIAGGAWEATGWDRDFWIDDIYFMTDDSFPVPPPPPTAISIAPDVMDFGSLAVDLGSGTYRFSSTTLTCTYSTASAQWRIDVFTTNTWHQPGLVSTNGAFLPLKFHQPNFGGGQPDPYRAPDPNVATNWGTATAVFKAVFDPASDGTGPGSDGFKSTFGSNGVSPSVASTPFSFAVDALGAFRTNYSAEVIFELVVE